jgi:putative FmdB family regulatory protein
MPLYEYECEVCGHRFETIQKFSDPLADTCPKCGGKVHKLFSSPAIQFKGTGWYITDYAKKDQTGAGKPGDASKDDGSGKDSEREGAAKNEGGKDAAPKDTAPKDAGGKSEKSTSSAESASGSSATGASTPSTTKD